jgi:ATP/maltotriose-dependent transcriptional regulator MalT
MAEEPNADIERGRAHYERCEWADAFEALLKAQTAAPLQRDDLARLVWSAALIGEDDEFLRTLELLHQDCVEADDVRQAARAAFWIGFRLILSGAPARASGWLARARRHIEGDDCAERGYLLLPTIFRHLGGGDPAAAEAVAAEAAEIGDRCGEADLVALARNLQGRALVRDGRARRGLALLDEVMVAVTSGELSPLVTGIVYCSVIATCQQVLAHDRAREWTAALASWCEQQPQLVAFTGTCRVHRSEVLQLAGDWPEALKEVRPICEDVFKDADPEILGNAHYQRAELHRLRGELTDAEAGYRRANQNGRDPQPGLALLRAAQGRQQEAVSAIERVMSTTTPRWQRARILPPFIEIMLVAGELDRARAASDELATIAQQSGTRGLGAIAAHARGAVRLAEGDAMGAIEPLRRAFRIWHRTEAPYQAARARVLLGRAYRALGDRDGTELELDAARRVFEKLGAAPELTALESIGDDPQEPGHGLTPRELEVLRLVATGKTNKAIAAELSLSERTIERHVSNIFTKIRVPSRAAATAFAYENDLV